MTVRTRFAPSPTGYLHVGGLRTALYAYLFARKNGGTLVLRVEDTDQSRYVPGATEALIRALDKTGIQYDEGPILAGDVLAEKGNFGPYLQSQRLAIYKEQVSKLIQNGSAYYCFCTKDRLDTLRSQQEIAKMQSKYDRHCASLSKEEIADRLQKGEPSVIRMRIPEGETAFIDMVRGSVVFKNQEIDDQVLLKSDGYPTYHLANVVDDHLMEITHVIRAEEWLSSTPKHVILYQMFGWEMPAFAHLPLILNPDRSKLSKRQGDVAVEDYLAKGYLPEALVNFVALLGFNPKADQEIYTLTELIESFDLEKINKSGAVFNVEKLDWMNGEYIRKMSPEALVEATQPFVNASGVQISPEMLKKICVVEQGRLVRLAEIVEKLQGYLVVPDFDPATLVWKKADANDAKTQLEGVLRHMTGESDETFASIALIEASIKRYIEGNGLKNGNVLWPTRVALSGRAASASPFELAWVLGREETIKRINHAIAKL